VLGCVWGRCDDMESVVHWEHIERCIFTAFYKDLKGKIRKHRSSGSLKIYEALSFPVLELFRIRKHDASRHLLYISWFYKGSVLPNFMPKDPGYISIQTFATVFVRVAEAYEPCNELLNEWELTCRVKKLVIHRINHESIYFY
jgi:hypothetical protein